MFRDDKLHLRKVVAQDQTRDSGHGIKPSKSDAGTNAGQNKSGGDEMVC